MKRFTRFLNGEDGAITADWVLLTAGIVGFGAIIYINFYPSIQYVDNQTGTALKGAQVRDLSFEISSGN